MSITLISLRIDFFSDYDYKSISADKYGEFDYIKNRSSSPGEHRYFHPV